MGVCWNVATTGGRFASHYAFMLEHANWPLLAWTSRNTNQLVTCAEFNVINPGDTTRLSTCGMCNVPPNTNTSGLYNTCVYVKVK